MSGLDILITTSYYWPEEAGSAPYLAGLARHLQAELETLDADLAEAARR